MGELIFGTHYRVTEVLVQVSGLVRDIARDRRLVRTGSRTYGGVNEDGASRRKSEIPRKTEKDGVLETCIIRKMDLTGEVRWRWGSEGKSLRH